MEPMLDSMFPWEGHGGKNWKLINWHGLIFSTTRRSPGGGRWHKLETDKLE